MRIEAQTTVADVATEYPATIRVFQRYGIDFCCGGKRALGDVCRERELTFESVQKDLQDALADRAALAFPWTRLGLRDVVEHIVERYHRPLDEELPRLAQMMKKVLSVHGERHPELAEISRTFDAIRQELPPHMLKEEQVLFPYIEKMDSLPPGGTFAGSPFGSIDNPIAVMLAEHETVGDELARLRELSGDYTPPADACNTFRGLFHGLATLERELHEHIHVENNVLFPRAQALEAELIARSPRRSA